MPDSPTPTYGSTPPIPKERDETNNDCEDIVNVGGYGGQLDPTFDEDGKAIADFGSEGSTGHAVAIQSDGKIVMAGNTSCTGCLNDFALARYNVDGSLDNSFGTGGLVTTDHGPKFLELGYAVAVQPDDKIVVAGGTLSGLSGTELVLERYNVDGSLDNSFGTGGRAADNFAAGAVGNDVAIQTDGKIVVVGSSNSDFALARYNIDGNLDSSFGTGGMVTTDFASGSDSISSVTIQPDGKIVVAGYAQTGSNYDLALARYNTNGGLDNTFGTGGMVTTDLGNTDYERISDIVIQPDGKIVATGNIINFNPIDFTFVLTRYHADGSLDNSFGVGAIVITKLGWNHAWGTAVALQSDGRIVAVGNVQNVFPVDSDFALARFNPDGSMDSTFGRGGIFTIDFGGYDSASDLAIQSDGKIVVGGTATINSKPNFALARFVPPIPESEESDANKRILVVGASGGTFSFGPVRVFIPAGLLSEGSRLVIEELDASEEGNFQLGNRIFDIKIYGPDGKSITSFDPPLKVCIRPTKAELQAAGWNFANLQIFHRHDGGSWAFVAYTYEENGYLCADISQLSFFVIGVAEMPDTGFAPGLVTTLLKQPTEEMYFELALGLSAAKGGVSKPSGFTLEIPSLNLEMPIVGVPLSHRGWAVTWLDDEAGYLQGTAYPTWAGNTAITAHVWDRDNNPGPFVDLHTLQHGDQIIIHAWGLRHIYEVRDFMQTSPDTLKALPHSEYDMLTLITCKDYNATSGDYDWRIAVQAVLVRIE